MSHNPGDTCCSILFCLHCGSHRVDVNSWVFNISENGPMANFICYDCHHVQLVEGLTIGRAEISEAAYLAAKADQAHQRPARKES